MADLGAPGDRLHVNLGTRVVITHLNVTQNTPDPTLNPNGDGCAIGEPRHGTASIATLADRE